MARKKGGSSRGGRKRGARSPRSQSNRQYPRTARLNALLQEIVADYFERVDDERFDVLTITGVEVDADLNRAQVFVSTFGHATTAAKSAANRTSHEDAEKTAEAAEAADEELLSALEEHRKAVRAAIAREARIRKTPEVEFLIDPAVRAGARIEAILNSIEPPADEQSS